MSVTVQLNNAVITITENEAAILEHLATIKDGGIMFKTYEFVLIDRDRLRQKLETV